MEYGVIVAVIVVLDEFLKKLGLRVELIPLLNVISAIVFNLVINGFSAESASHGFFIGLVACGLFDQSKISKLINEILGGTE